MVQVEVLRFQIQGFMFLFFLERFKDRSLKFLRVDVQSFKVKVKSLRFNFRG